MVPVPPARARAGSWGATVPRMSYRATVHEVGDVVHVMTSEGELRLWLVCGDGTLREVKAEELGPDGRLR